MGVLDDNSGHGYNISETPNSGNPTQIIGLDNLWEHEFLSTLPAFFNVPPTFDPLPSQLINTVNKIDNNTVFIEYNDGFPNDPTHIKKVYSYQYAYNIAQFVEIIG